MELKVDTDANLVQTSVIFLPQWCEKKNKQTGRKNT